jgi:signal peptide peptidase SppA
MNTKDAIGPFSEKFWMLSDSGLAALGWVLKHPEALTAIRSRQGTNAAVSSRREGNVAVIEISGTLTKYENYLTGIIFGTATTEAKRLVDAAAADPNVSRIMLCIESPGGQAQGTGALADSVYAAAQRKPVMAFCEDLCASAAYWIGSAASSVWATKSALVGSIGTFCVVCDFSGAADQAGVKVHVVQSEGGKFKGVLTPGTAVTPEQLAEVQKVVDSINADFVGGVSRGRKIGIDQAQKLADGRIHVGAQAVAAGLLDKIGSFDEAMTALLDMPTRGDDEDDPSTSARTRAPAILRRTSRRLKWDRIRSQHGTRPSR